MNVVKTLLGVSRLPFLTLTPVCVMLGVSVSKWQGSEIDAVHLMLLIFGAFAAHISVNTFNEYFDFKSGLDLTTVRTPFSGGSGSLPANPQAVFSVLMLAVTSLLISCFIGIYFVLVIGWQLLLLGLIGVFLICFYTGWINRHPLLCLFAPGVGFALMVEGSYFVVAGRFDLLSFLVSMVVLLLVSNLLLLNQFPDLEADKAVGRNHLPILIGRKKSSVLFALQLLICYPLLAVIYFWGSLPVIALCSLATIVLAIPLGVGVIRYAEQQSKLLPYMGMNVLLVHLLPLLLSVAFLTG